MKLLCGHMSSVLLGKDLGVELPGHMLTPCLAFQGAARLFTKVMVLCYIPTSTEFQFLHIFSNTCYCLFYFSPSRRREVVSCDLDLHFLSNEWVEHLVMFSLAVCPSAQEKCLCRAFLEQPFPLLGIPRDVFTLSSSGQVLCSF